MNILFESYCREHKQRKQTDTQNRPIALHDH